MRRAISQEVNSIPGITEAAQYGRSNAEQLSYINEVLQEIGKSNSAWSGEDLISNELGRQMGFGMVIHDLTGIGLHKNGLPVPFTGTTIGANSPMPLSEFYDISEHWDGLLKESGALKWEGKKMPECIQRQLDHVRKHGPPTARSVDDALKVLKKSEVWRCLCHGDQPRDPDHRF